MSIEKILIVDDEMLMRDFLAETLRRKQFDVYISSNGDEALKLMEEETFDLVIADIRMPGITGIELLKEIKTLSPQTLVVMITAYGSIETAVEAMRLGAFTYLLKPFSPDTIEALVEKAKEHLSLVAENCYLKEEVHTPRGQNGKEIIAASPIMKEIVEKAKQIAQSSAHVLITGDSGTGKEVIAKLIHDSSPRSQNPYIKVNCAAMPETLIESEFFGHEKGAFTGANGKKLGRFELANTGTLLLDEITEVPLSLQAKLLRAIQEKEFDRVGGTKPITVDVRIISTSNRDMQKAILEKTLREDLYFRLNVVPIQIPPLRERVEDIIPLAEYFIRTLCKENHKDRMHLAENAKEKLLNYKWPGNVRELANVIERAIVMCQEDKLTCDHLYIEQNESLAGSSGAAFERLTLEELEKRHIIETLHAEEGNRTKTAEVLGISVKTLRNKLEQYKV